MKHLLTALTLVAVCVVLSVTAPAHAADASTVQQSKMGSCNQDAAGKKGDERKAFMKSCLSAKKEGQQSKMKTCNASAKGQKGAERKAFMKECLSK